LIHVAAVCQCGCLCTAPQLQLFRMWWTWFFTVGSVMVSWRAISLFVIAPSPRLTRNPTPVSRFGTHRKGAERELDALAWGKGNVQPARPT